MNTHTAGCDRSRIDAFLNSDQAGIDDAPLVEHLDSCAACRQYMERQAAEPEAWSRATELLQPTEFDRAGSAEFSAATTGLGHVNRPIVIQNVLESLAPSDDPHRLGRLGGYEISGVVGIGGMGVVLKAIDPALDRVVAIKVLAPHLAHSGTARRRFSREAKAAAAVLHPNVIPIHSVSSDDKIPYLVMAYIRGGSLQKRLDREGPLSTVEILRIGSQVAAGLAAAHEQGLVHRDVKPENILLEEGVERITLTDFGLARAVDDASVTQPGTIAGTPQYMSPEQTRGEPVDQQSDLFSLGCVLYALCTGHPPFRAESSYAVMRKISDESPMPIRELNPEIPEWLCAIIDKLMAKKKADRFKSADEVHGLLETCLGHAQQPTVTKLPEIPQFLPKKNNSPILKILIGVFTMVTVVTGLLLAFGVLAFQSEGERQQEQKGTQEIHTVNAAQDGARPQPELLGHGYVRDGQHVFFDGKRIDQEGSHDLKRFARTLSRELKLASNVDAASFKALSEEYTKDKDMVYYKWISPGRFWVVELPEADPTSFESVAFNLAKDHKRVWWYGDVLKGLDPKTLEVVNANFVWKDSDSVWYQHERIADADPSTFKHIGQAYYRDKNRVYWGMTPLDGADPTTFRSFGDDTPYGADKNSVWRATETVPKVDPATFGVVHESVYKDKTGVYSNGLRVSGASPETTRKLADLNEHLTALLTDGENHFVFVALWNEVYRIEPKADGLHVSREVWEGRTSPERRLGTMSALLTEQGWQDLKAPESELWGKNYYEQREAQTLSQFKNEFEIAWEILTGRKVTVGTSEEFARIMNAPAAGDYAEPTDDDFVLLREYRKTQRKFDGYYRQWLALHPEIQAQVDDGRPIDVAEIFGAELFGGAESKFPAEDLNDWRATALTLTQNMFAIQLRRLRPPAPETQILRNELIRQAAELLGKEAILEGKDAEDVIDPQIDQWRLHFPEFLSLQPAAEKQLRSGQSINEPEERIKAAKAVLDDAEIEISRMAEHLLKKHELNKLTPLQKELLAQLITAESLAVKEQATAISQEQARLKKLVEDNPIVVRVSLEKGSFTGAMNLHRVNVQEVYKGKADDVRAVFAHLAAGDSPLPVRVEPDRPRMPTLKPGEYVLVLQTQPVTNSSAVSSFGLRVTPEESFHYIIARDADRHAAWPVGSPEAEQVLALCGGEGTGQSVDDPQENGNEVSANLLKDGDYTLQITHTAENPKVRFPTDAIPETEYKKVEEPASVMQFSADLKTLRLVGFGGMGELESRAGETLVYTFDRGLDASGGPPAQVIVKQTDNGITATLTQFGSGVPVIVSHKGTLTEGKKQASVPSDGDAPLTWKELFGKEPPAGYPTEPLSLIAALNKSRGEWVFAGRIERDDSVSEFEASMEIQGGVQKMIRQDSFPQWQVAIAWPREASTDGMVFNIMALPEPAGIKWMVVPQYFAKDGKPVRGSYPMYEGAWNAETETIVWTSKQLRSPLKKDTPAEDPVAPQLTFQMVIKPNGEISISGYQHNESLNFSGQSAARVGEPYVEKGPAIQKLPGGYSIFFASRLEVYLEAPARAEGAGPRIAKIGCEGKYIFGLVAAHSKMKSDETPGYFWLDSETGQITKGLELTAWREALKSNGVLEPRLFGPEEVGEQ